MLRPTLLCCLACGIAAAAATGSLGFHFEPGVEARPTLGLAGEWEPLSWLSWRAGLDYALFDNPGVAGVGLGARARPLARVPAGIEIGLAHAQWSDWDASESRAWAMVFGELGAVELGAGLAVRSPAAGTDVFVLSGPAAELNLLYRAEWAFAQDSRKAVSVWVSNLSENDMHTPQQVPFGAAGTFRLAERWSLGARAGTGIKGLSALLLSFGDITTRVGVTYEQ